MRIQLENDFCVILHYPEEKEVSGWDKTDRRNEPAFYTITKRGIKKGWAECEEKFNEKTSMRDIELILLSHGVRLRNYCAID